MPWPATVGLNQLAYGVINAMTNNSSDYPLAVLNPGGTAAIAAATNQTILAAIVMPGATTGAAAVALIPGINCQSAIATASTLRVSSLADDRGRSLIVFLTPATP